MSEEVFNKELKERIEQSLAKQELKPMPKSAFKSFDEFQGLFDEIKGNKGVIQTPYKDVEVDIRYAFIHFKKNTYNANRDNIKGGFFETFKNPLFVVEQKERVAPSLACIFISPFTMKIKSF